ncbi:MAG: branched-chain amino acid aminotransferase [Kiritimatiellae bacterium]|nr:branched-chain amino acid aminotransferase [Kiritimatiellia bacterium]
MPKEGIDWANLGFGFSEVNCHIRYVWRDGKWSEGEFIKKPEITMHIGASCLHYGQECFEGMKAFRQKDGKIIVFRPEENAKRMARTAERCVMPAVPVDMFVEAVDKVVRANEEYVPPYGTGGSLYIRPLLIGTGPQIGVAPAKEFTFMVIVMPVGAYYKGGLKPVRAVILDDWDRAAPLGMGDVKVGGNYAASLYAHEKAKREGWPVELYLDAKTHQYVEEFSTSNFLGITKDGTYVTPDSRSVLPSITNLSLMQCAEDLGWKVERRPIPYTEIKDFAEVAACGTAVVVTPVWEITRGDDIIVISDKDAVGEHLQKLYETVQGIQYGVLEDVHGWCHEVPL